MNEIFQNPSEILSGETHEPENELALTADLKPIGENFRKRTNT